MIQMQVALPSLGQQCASSTRAVLLSDTGLCRGSTPLPSTVAYEVKSLGQGTKHGVKVRSGSFVWPLLSSLPNDPVGAQVQGEGRYERSCLSTQQWSLPKVTSVR